MLLDLPKPPHDVTTEEGKRAVFLKALKYCTFRENTRVRQADSKRCGEIVDIARELDKISWNTRGIPLFITVKWDDGATTLHNPYQLTYKRVRK